MVLAVLPGANAQVAPVLTWITNSSLKLEQVIGDIDWAANAQGSNLPLAVPICTRAAIHLIGRAVSLRSRAAMASLPGSEPKV